MRHVKPCLDWILSSYQGPTTVQYLVVLSDTSDDELQKLIVVLVSSPIQNVADDVGCGLLEQLLGVSGFAFQKWQLKQRHFFTFLKNT